MSRSVGSKIHPAASIHLAVPVPQPNPLYCRRTHQTKLPDERLLTSTLPDEGVGHRGGVLIVLGGGVGVGGRVEALAAGVEDEGVALVGEAEPAVLVHGRIPGAEEESDGNGEEEADGHGGELVRLDLA